MAVDWNDYLTLAKELSTDPTEAKMRSAISRSYYCAFNKARIYIKSIKPDYYYYDHKDLWNQFLDIENKTDVKTYGERIRQARTKADYDRSVANLKWEMVQTLRNVEFVLEKLQQA